MEQEYQMNELTAATLSTFPIRLKGCQLALCECGTACINVSLKKYSLRAGSVVWLFPGYIILLTEASADFRMSSFSFSQSFQFDAFHSIPTEKIAYLRENSSLHFTDSTWQQLCLYLSMLKAKCADHGNKYQRDLLISCLRLFLYEACHYIERQEATVGTGFRGNELKNQFLALVISSSREHRQVAYYADKLCVTPRHLTMTLQRILGRTAKEWIDDYVTLEVKILLRSSSLSIQEIADHLNFPDQSYLGRFFKHQTGMSPSRYREENRELLPMLK